MSDEFEDYEVNDEVNDTENISMEDMTSLIEESKTLLSKLYSDSKTTKMMTQDDLRNDVSSFVSSRLKDLENQNRLKGLLVAEIAKKVMTHDLSTDEIFRAYSMISSEGARNIDSLFKLFIPTQTTPNTILSPAVKDEEKETTELSSSQRQALEKLTRIIAQSEKKTEE